MLLKGQRAASSAAPVAGEEGKVVNIYCWNTEFQDRNEAYAADLADKHGVTVNFVIMANENNAYQNNLDAALMAQETAAADDWMDPFLVEAEYASKYTKTDFALDVMADVGLIFFKNQTSNRVNAQRLIVICGSAKNCAAASKCREDGSGYPEILF